MSGSNRFLFTERHKFPNFSPKVIRSRHAVMKSIVSTVSAEETCSPVTK